MWKKNDSGNIEINFLNSPMSAEKTDFSQMTRKSSQPKHKSYHNKVFY